MNSQATYLHVFYRANDCSITASSNQCVMLFINLHDSLVASWVTSIALSPFPCSLRMLGHGGDKACIGNVCSDRARQHSSLGEWASLTFYCGVQVLLQWGLRNGTSILPKSTSPERIKVNLWMQQASLSGHQHARM